jgi:8-oxo-dGTP diphosphatase
MLGAYSKVDRDARGRVVSIAYLGLIREADIPHDARALCVPFTRAKGLGYDHTDMGCDALERLRHAFTETTIAQKLLPESFTITEMHALYETVLGKGIDKRNFLKKIKSLDIIHETGEMVTGKKNRPAKLFAFKKQNVEHLDIF